MLLTDYDAWCIMRNRYKDKQLLEIMGLEDLIIDKKQITDTFLEEILKGNVELVKEGKSVSLTQESLKFSSKTKILLYLCGIKAWDLIDGKQDPSKTSISELSQALGILNATMRSLLKELRDNGLVSSDKGKYFVLPKGVLVIKNLIKSEKEKKESTMPSRGARKKRVSKESGRFNIVQKFKENPLPSGYTEEILPILEKASHQDRYLLAIYIAREKIGINGLTASEINILLSEPPLRLPKLYTSNISRDLGKMRKYVTPYRVENDRGFEYRLTSFGETRVIKLIKEFEKKLEKKYFHGQRRAFENYKSADRISAR